MRSILFILIISIFTLSATSAQDVIFKQEISYDTVLIGNVLQIKYSFENTNGDFQAPAFVDFDVVSGPNVSSQYSMINGAVTQSASYSYVLRPTHEGLITIESAKLINRDQEWTTEPMDIFVAPNPNGIIQNPRGYGFRQEIIYRDSVSVAPIDSMKMKLKKLKTYKI